MKHAIDGWDPQRHGFTFNATSGVGDLTPIAKNGLWIMADTQDVGGDGLVHFLVYDEPISGDPILDTVDLGEARALLRPETTEKTAVKVKVGDLNLKALTPVAKLVQAAKRVLGWQDSVYQENLRRQHQRFVGSCYSHCECEKCSICELRTALTAFE